MNDSALNAAMLAWCFRGDAPIAEPKKLAESVQVALEAARPFIEAPLRAEIERLAAELAEERTRAQAVRDRLLNLLVAQGDAVVQ